MDCLNDNKKGGGAVAVAFDMDGLMFETESVYWKSADILLGRRGHKYTQELCDATMGRPPECTFRLFIERFAFPEDWRTLQRESEDIFIELHERRHNARQARPSDLPASGGAIWRRAS